ncbi:hypothetical protein [Pedobacter sp. ASV28]|uniref:hypothetical protein n=1 Tax=Pedobacter sp. ASV28 TaxID=2795123 RepID=UPI0018EA8DB4|nr:hypothetical protein [Pedobacter sp. ASV28]
MMNSYEKSVKKAQVIRDSIETIRLREYKNLGYAIDKWELSLETNPHIIPFSEYSRVYIFNNQVDTLVNKFMAENYKLLTENELENGITKDLKAFLVLKYPYSQVPEFDDIYHEDIP